MAHKPITILSDGCYPTEALYFKLHIAPKLNSKSIYNIREINCKQRGPKEFLNKCSAEETVIVFRTLPRDWVNHLYEIRSSVAQIIYVFDDDLKAACETPELPEKYRSRISLFASDHMPLLLELADNIIVSTEYLSEKYMEFRPEIIHPITIIKERGTSHYSSSNLSIFYHATSSHREDLSFISAAIERALHKGNTVFESMMGKATPVSLAKNDKTKTRLVRSWRAFRIFQRFAKRHIGLAPLLDTPYNRGKSHIKFLDIAAVGAVGIYSDRPPYSNIVQHGVNGLLASDNIDDWYEQINCLVKQPLYAAYMAQNAQKSALDMGHPRRAYRTWLKILKTH